MKRLSAISLLLSVVTFTVFGCASPSPEPGWVTLIDGDKGLENWSQIGDANWRNEAGAIVADKGKSGFLVSKNAYKDLPFTPSSGPKPTPTAVYFCEPLTLKKSAPTHPMK